MTDFEHWAEACADRDIQIKEITRGTAYPRTGIYMTVSDGVPYYHVVIGGRFRHSTTNRNEAKAFYERSKNP